MEDVIRGAHAVGFGIVPVEMVVVNKSAIENHTAVGRRPQPTRWPRHAACGKACRARLAFRVNLYESHAKSGDELVNLIRLGTLPGFHRRGRRVVRFEAADGLRAGDCDRHGQVNTPGAEGVGDTGDLLEVVGVEELRGGVDVVDVAAVDSDGGEETRVFGDGGKIVANVAVFEEDRPSRVAALDGARRGCTSTQRILNAGLERRLRRKRLGPGPMRRSNANAP